MQIQLNPHHGWVLANIIGSYIVHHTYMGMAVVSARKKYGVKYPAEYADPSVNKEADAFNCVQRGHQNSLENQASFLSLLMAAGVRYPLSASIAGAMYLVGRVAYFRGYCSGDPKGRYRGGFLHLAQLALVGMVGKFAWDLLSSA